MSLSNVNNHILSLIQTGNDAEGHLYEVVFSGGLLTEHNQSLSVRCSGFTEPEATQDTYTVRYITAYIDRPSAKVKLTRSFPLTFRADSYWNVYKALLKQQSITSNPSHNYVRSNLNDLIDKGLLFNVSVYIIKELNFDTSTLSKEDSDNFENRETIKLFDFKHCWIEKLSTPKFTGEDSKPITVDATINFLQMQDWASGITGDKEHSNKITLSYDSINNE